MDALVLLGLSHVLDASEEREERSGGPSVLLGGAAGTRIALASSCLCDGDDLTCVCVSLACIAGMASKWSFGDSLHPL